MSLLALEGWSKLWFIAFCIPSAKKSDSTADTSKLEKQIDQLVYQLYDLTEEEIKIVEGNAK